MDNKTSQLGLARLGLWFLIFIILPGLFLVGVFGVLVSAHVYQTYFHDDSGTQPVIVNQEKPAHLTNVGYAQVTAEWEVRVVDGKLVLWVKRYRETQFGLKAEWNKFVYPEYPRKCHGNCYFYLTTAAGNRFLIEKVDNGEYRLYIPSHWIVRQEVDKEFDR